MISMSPLFGSSNTVYEILMSCKHLQLGKGSFKGPIFQETLGLSPGKAAISWTGECLI